MPELNQSFLFKDNRGRGAGGRFTGGDARRELLRISEDVAKQVQLEAVRNLEGSIERESVSTGRLRKVTAAPENRVFGPQGFAVGIDKYLNGSIAKYWRTIEEGSARTFPGGGMAGMELYGQFRTSLTGFYSNAWGRVPASGDKRSPKGDRGGKFRPFSEALIERLKANGFRPAIVRNEIAPHRYYGRAYESVDPGKQMSKRGLAALSKAASAAIEPPGF